LFRDVDYIDSDFASVIRQGEAGNKLLFPAFPPCPSARRRISDVRRLHGLIHHIAGGAQFFQEFFKNLKSRSSRRESAPLSSLRAKRLSRLTSAATEGFGFQNTVGVACEIS